MEAHLDRERRGRAQYVLGKMYQSGDGVPRNIREAVKCFRMAAELGDVNGLYNLGRMYQRGTEVNRDYREAEKWFRKAAVKGYDKAQVQPWCIMSERYGTPNKTSGRLKNGSLRQHSRVKHVLKTIVGSNMPKVKGCKRTTSWLMCGCI